MRPALIEKLFQAGKWLFKKEFIPLEDILSDMAGKGLKVSSKKLDVDFGQLPEVTAGEVKTANGDNVENVIGTLKSAVNEARELAESGVWSAQAAQAAIPQPANANPEAPGSAAPGSSTKYARADHVHPSDNTTYSAATQSAAGLMSAADKTIFDDASSHGQLGNPVHLGAVDANTVIESGNYFVNCSSATNPIENREY